MAVRRHVRSPLYPIAPHASHTRRVIRGVLFLVSLLGALGSAGCGSAEPSGPRTIDGGFPAQGDIAPLPIRVSDLPGVIRSVSIADSDPGREGVSPVPGRDDALYVHWMGGMCDRGAEVVVDRAGAGLAITIRTQRDFGGCRMAGIPRTLMLETTEPVDVSAIGLEVLD